MLVLAAAGGCWEAITMTGFLLEIWPQCKQARAAPPPPRPALMFTWHISTIGHKDQPHQGQWQFNSINNNISALCCGDLIVGFEYLMFSRWLAGRPRCATQGVSRSPLCSWEILIFANGIKYFYMVRVSQTLFIWLKPVELWPNKAGREGGNYEMNIIMSIEWCHFTGSLCARVSVFCITGLGAGVWLLVTLYTVSSSS